MTSTTVTQASDHPPNNTDQLNFVSTQTQIYDDLLKQQSIGLVTAEEYKRKKQIIDTVKHNAQQQIHSTIQKSTNSKPVKKQKVKLSFTDDTEDTTVQPSTAVINDKNPALDTTHLPDTKRDIDIEVEKQRLKQQWLAEQEQLKQSSLTVLYSYYDGTSHRNKLEVKHSDTVEYFLRNVKNTLKAKFTELAAKNAELMFVKCDTILPNNLTFYDLITNQINQKTKVLADFGVDSYPPKVMLKSYFDRHKHVYPYKDYTPYQSLFKDQH